MKFWKLLYLMLIFVETASASIAEISSNQTSSEFIQALTKQYSKNEEEEVRSYSDQESSNIIIPKILSNITVQKNAFSSSSTKRRHYRREAYDNRRYRNRNRYSSNNNQHNPCGFMTILDRIAFNSKFGCKNGRGSKT